MKLTNIAVKNAKPKDKPYYLPDGDNLSLLVTPNGTKIWRLGYRHNNKRKQIALGKYPVLSLADAREMKLEKQKLVTKGIDPVEARRQNRFDYEMKYENNFEAIAREWHNQRIHTWEPKHADVIMKRLSTFIFPKLGGKPITEIKPQELLHVIRQLEEQGKHNIAHRMLQTSGQIAAFQSRLKEITGTKVSIASVRAMIAPSRLKNGIDGSAEVPDWCNDWVYVTSEGKFYNMQTLKPHSDKSFNVVCGHLVPATEGGYKLTASL